MRHGGRPRRRTTVYQRPTYSRFTRLIQFSGSVIPSVLPGVTFSGFLTFAVMYWDLNGIKSDWQEAGAKWFFHPSTYAMFLQFAAFLLAFHVQKAYSRYWDARTQLQIMNAQWSALASDLVSFDVAVRSMNNDASIDRYEKSVEFRAHMIHMISMLHAVSIERLVGETNKKYELDIFGAPTSYECEQIRASGDRGYSVQTLITTDVTQRFMEGTLSVPGPWFLGIHGALGAGAAAFDAATRIKDTPFPFMYIQLHYLVDVSVIIVTPLLMASYFKSIPMGVAFTMLVVFSSHCLFIAAFVMETPFGLRSSDLPLVNLHNDFLDKLRQLIDADVADALDAWGVEKTSSASSLHLGKFSVRDLGRTREHISRFHFDLMSEIKSNKQMAATYDPAWRQSYPSTTSVDVPTLPEDADACGETCGE